MEQYGTVEGGIGSDFRGGIGGSLNFSCFVGGGGAGIVGAGGIRGILFVGGRRGRVFLGLGFGGSLRLFGRRMRIPIVAVDIARGCGCRRGRGGWIEWALIISIAGISSIAMVVVAIGIVVHVVPAANGAVGSRQWLGWLRVVGCRCVGRGGIIGIIRRR